MVSNEPNPVTFDSLSKMLNTPKDISEVMFLNDKLSSVLEKCKVKNEMANSAILITTPLSIKNYEISVIDKTNLLESKKNLLFLVDFQNFLNSNLEQHEKIIKDHFTIFQNLIHNVKNMGSVFILIDYYYVLRIRELIYDFVKNNPTTNLLLKLFIVEKTPMLIILCIQKFEQKQIVNIPKMQFILYEMYSNLELSDHMTIPLIHIEKTIENFTDLYSFQIALRKFEKGRAVKIPIKTKNFWEEETMFLMIIIDTKNDELAEKRNCAAIIVTKNYANDYLYNSEEGNLILCEQINYARVILIKPNMFNNDDIDSIKEHASTYIKMFTYENNITDKIPIHLISDSLVEKYEVFRGDGIVIRDIEESGTKDIYRQLMFDNNENQIQSEIKLKLSSKVKAKENKFTILPTVEKFSIKNLVTCPNNEYISNFYQRTIIAGFFLIKNNFPKDKLRVLILGAGIGSLGIYLREVYGNNVLIDSVEINENFKKIGEKYFGFSDFEGNKWYFEDGLKFVESRVNSEVKYDVIINDINNFSSQEGISPPGQFFLEGFLKNINIILNDYGMYMINFLTRSALKFKEMTKLLKTNFSKVLYIENNDDLNKIYLLFKNVEGDNKSFNMYLIKQYTSNLMIFKENCNLKIIEGDYQRVLKNLHSDDS